MDDFLYNDLNRKVANLEKEVNDIKSQMAKIINILDKQTIILENLTTLKRTF